MYEGKTVGVVVAAYNEEGFVGEVIDTLPEFVDRAYVVDDGSTDGTWHEIQHHARRANGHAASIKRASTGNRSQNGGGQATVLSTGTRDRASGDGGFDRQVVPIRHDTNKGVGGAIQTGYRRALEEDIDVTVVMAGDGQMDPDECHRLVAPVAEGEADYAKGNRLLDAELREEMSTWRLFGNTLLTLLTKVASGYWQMMDPANGYTAISREALHAIDIEELYDDYGTAHDILIRLNVEDMCVADVPMPASYGEEQSDIEYSSFVPNLSMLLARQFLWRLKTKYVVRDCHPLVLLYGLGVLGGTVAVVEWLRARLDSDASRVRSVLAGILFLVSATLVTLGMAFDRLDNQNLELRAEE